MSKSISLSQIANELNISYIGDDVQISGINTLKDASSSQLSFCDNPKYVNDLKITKAKAVLLKEELVEYLPLGCIALVSNQPYLLLAYATKLFAPNVIEQNGKEPIIGENCNIMSNVAIGKNTTIGNNCILMSGVFIGDNATIGDNTIIYPNVTIYRDCKVGNNCILHANTVVGSDGFGFAHTKDGQHVKIYQNGNVEIGNAVEIGSNCSIDRGVFGATKILDGVKMDNLIHIAHNCEIGEYTIITGQVGIAGSSKLGRNTVLGAQSGVAGHLEIAPFTTIAARGGVTKSIKEGGKTWAGFPLSEHKTWLKLQAKISNLLK